MRVLAAAFLLFAGASSAQEDAFWFDDLLSHLRVPSEFKLSVFTDKVGSVRSLALSPTGIVYATQGRSNNGVVYGCRDTDGDGSALSPGECWPVTAPMIQPNGIAFMGTDLFVAMIDRICVIRDVDTDPTTIKDCVQILGPESSEGAADGLPTYTHHGWRYLTADPVTQTLAVAIGAPCNVPWTSGSSGGVADCANQGAGGTAFPLLSTVATLNPDGSEFQVAARGVRNSVGITYHPDTGEMWFTDNGRDQWGSSGSSATPDTSASPPDELNRLGSPGAAMPDFGFPECYGRELPDTAIDGQGRPFNPSGQCDQEQYIGSVSELPSHSAALGLRFYNESAFPARYHGSCFIAEHGSWNRDPPSGFVLSTVDVGDPATATAVTSLERKTDATYEEFMTGFRLYPKVECSSTADCPGNSTCQMGAPNIDNGPYCGGRGRPVDVEVLRDGTVLLSDDMNGLIYRIEYIGDGDAQDAGSAAGASAVAGLVRSEPLWWMLCSALMGMAVTLGVLGCARLCCRREPQSEGGSRGGSLLTQPLAAAYSGGKEAL